MKVKSKLYNDCFATEAEIKALARTESERQKKALNMKRSALRKQNNKHLRNISAYHSDEYLENPDAVKNGTYRKGTGRSL